MTPVPVAGSVMVDTLGPHALAVAGPIALVAGHPGVVLQPLLLLLSLDLLFLLHRPLMHHLLHVIHLLLPLLPRKLCLRLLP